MRQITYTDFGNTSCIDHVKTHEYLIDELNIKSVIEFGVGEGTKVFLKACDRVTSVELYTSNYKFAEELKISTDEWINHCKEQYTEYEGYSVVLYDVGHDILEAERDVTGANSPRVGRGDNPSSTAYKKELRELIDTLNVSEYDLAFVDAGVHLRGDIVNLLFNRVDVITAHDYNTKNIYGYSRVIVPNNYDEFEGIGSKEGVGVFIKNEE